ncbi:MAG: phenylalanine--tRNA ligase subunit alpha [Candidatus Wildermuthbacteria bacterium]|nr:phenylalanine--tRNA ligase subunit alpha [Candidatus Wildermuthbacteria bacterium]
MDINELKTRAENELKTAKNLPQLEEVFRSYLGKKGELTLILRSLAKLAPAEKKKMGEEANALKKFIEDTYGQKSRELKPQFSKDGKMLDVTAPGKKLERGHAHPLTQVMRRMNEIFQSMGFEVAEGPEVEDEWHNFDALNVPFDHPAREMQDTFFLKQTGRENLSQKQKLVMRTQTSDVQIRYMETHKPPLRIVAPGRIFRNEATDARHEFNFYQLEGLMVGSDVSAAHFKAILQEFYQKFFEKQVVIRLRPSYFPFVEPGFEVDMTCVFCAGKGCASCGRAGWMEIMGAGMVHPNVFKAVGYNPKGLQGFAFGMGVERLAMMKYQIPDIRLFYSGDLRFLNQF